MNESILMIVKILGILFLLYKFINIGARISDTSDIIDLMGETFSLRLGNFDIKH